MMSRRTYSPIGIDVTPRCIRAVQLVGRTGSWRLHSAVAIPRDGEQPDTGWTPPTEAEFERLAGVLYRQAFEGTEVVLSVPTEKMISSVVELPPRASGAPLEALAAAELGRVHRIEGPGLQVACWEVPAPSRTSAANEYMVVGCTEQDALDLIDPYDKIGMSVGALDVRALALQRACAPTIPGDKGIDAILCLAWNHATLLFVVDGVVTFQRTLDGADGRALAAGVANKLQVSPASVAPLVLRHASCALSSGTPARRDIEREIGGAVAAYVESVATQFGVSCSYISRRYADRAVRSVAITGEFGHLPGLAEQLERGTMRARRFDLGDAVEIAETADKSNLGPAFIAPLGMAMRPMRGAA